MKNMEAQPPRSEKAARLTVISNPEETQLDQGRKEHQGCHLMLFCALILVKNLNVTLEQTSSVISLSGSAKLLCNELAKTPDLIPTARHSFWLGQPFSDAG